MDTKVKIIKDDSIMARKVEDPDGQIRFQTLQKHLSNVADLAIKFAKPFQTENIFKLIAYLHDAGKATAKFQNYLMGEQGRRGSVFHSIQGAILSYLADDDNATQFLREILALAIAGHHSDLADACSPDGTETFLEKLDKPAPDLCYEEMVGNIELEQVKAIFSRAKTEASRLIKPIFENYSDMHSANFALGLLVKYLYSCLIDADRLDAYLFEAQQRYQDKPAAWQGLIETFEANISGFRNDRDIDKIRADISNKCRKAAERECGIYHLSAPTGGGKTLSSLRFALHHCKEKGKKRIIYVIPYLSIIEQTAKNIRDILNLGEQSDFLLEHHSNITLPEDERECEIRKLATSRWDSPIIITTMVEFLETVMSSSAGKLRKFHSMAEAVIIFDEIQSLPLKCVHLFNEVVTFLSKVCGSTILLCTATQPLLHEAERKNLPLSPDCELVDNVEEAFEKLRRTKLVVEREMDIDSLSQFVFDKATENGNCLAILNTKVTARALFEKLKLLNGGRFGLYHLSNSMCSAHKKNVINAVIKALDEKRPIICVATQLVEAGVDISFRCVVRAMAGLDSITQAAGRCNRHGEDPVKEVYIVPIASENLNNLEEIKEGKEVTSKIYREESSLDTSRDMMKKFYDYYYHRRKNIMYYPTKTGVSVYTMLSQNDAGKKNYYNRNKSPFPGTVAQAFKSADECFSVIDKNAKAVIVCYDKSEELIERYRSLPKDKAVRDKIPLIRQLEKYGVSLFEHEFSKLWQQGAISSLSDDGSGILVLSKAHYSQEMGVIFDIGPQDLII